MSTPLRRRAGTMRLLAFNRLCVFASSCVCVCTSLSDRTRAKIALLHVPTVRGMVGAPMPQPHAVQCNPMTHIFGELSSRCHGCVGVASYAPVLRHASLSFWASLHFEFGGSLSDGDTLGIQPLRMYGTSPAGLLAVMPSKYQLTQLMSHAQMCTLASHPTR